MILDTFALFLIELNKNLWLYVNMSNVKMAVITNIDPFVCHFDV